MTKGDIGKILKAFQYFVKGDASKLDHQPISSVINIMEEDRRGSYWKMKIRYFDEVVEKIKEVWETFLLKATLFAKMKRIMKW
jgi:hypothetical protein